jgi:hypothetical protein
MYNLIAYDTVSITYMPLDLFDSDPANEDSMAETIMRDMVMGMIVQEVCQAINAWMYRCPSDTK